MKQRVLFLMFAFPDMNKSFNMYTTLVEQFVANGHEVVVLAPGNQETGIYPEANIPILRVKTLPIKNVPNYLKGIANLLLPYQFEKALARFYPGNQFDLIISPTPPITLVHLAAKLKKKFGSKFYLILRDIFPQNAVDLGFMKKGGLLHRYFRAKEKKLYNEADFIGCMSHGNINYLLQHNSDLSSSKCHELKNFQKLYSNNQLSKDNLAKKYQIDNKFVVVFGGNMGKPQQLENVLELVKRCTIYPDVQFLLLGEGVQMQKLEEYIKKAKLTNIKIQRTIPKNEYQDLLSICHVGLISLHQDFTIPNIPSKALDYWNVGLPILASLDAATDFGNVLDEIKSGLWCMAGNHYSFELNFKTLYKNNALRKEMGINGRNYFEKQLTPDIAYQTIIQTTIK